MSKTDRVVQKYVLDKVVAERDSQDEKWGDEELFGASDLWFPILVEEIGELATDIKDGKDIREELTQVTAVAVGWLEDIEHEQERIKQAAKSWNEHRKTRTVS